MVRSSRYLALSDQSGSRPSIWRRLGIALLLLLPVAVILGLLLLLSLLGLKFSNTDEDYGCDPNNNIWITNAHRPDLWAKNYGLAITLGFGNFSFTAAKAVDILFDLVVGRGCQVLAAILVYYTFRGPVVATMQQSSVPYQKVLKMEYHTAGLSAFITYAQDLGKQRRAPFQYFAAFMLMLSTLYVLTMPTFISAMSGYQPVDDPLLKLNNSTFIALSDLVRCTYIIQDGSRVGLQTNACIQSGSQIYDSVADYLTKYVDYQYTGGWTGNAVPLSAADKSSAISIQGHYYQLHLPVLNITWNSFEDPRHAVFYESTLLNATLTATYLMEHGWCSPQKIYRWGFSLILLFMFLCVTLLESILLYIVWLGHFWGSYGRDTQTKMVFGSLRTSLAVAESMRAEMGPEAVEMGNETLENVLAATGARMSLRSVGTERSRFRTSREDVHLQKLASAQNQLSGMSSRTSVRHERSTSRTSFL